jgi:hypothetical protein
MRFNRRFDRDRTLYQGVPASHIGRAGGSVLAMDQIFFFVQAPPKA